MSSRPTVHIPRTVGTDHYLAEEAVMTERLAPLTGPDQSTRTVVLGSVDVGAATEALGPVVRGVRHRPSARRAIGIIRVIGDVLEDGSPV